MTKQIQIVEAELQEKLMAKLTDVLDEINNPDKSSLLSQSNLEMAGFILDGIEPVLAQWATRTVFNKVEVAIKNLGKVGQWKVSVESELKDTGQALDQLPDLLTVKEVAALLRVSPLTIKRWGKRGKLPAIRINSRGDRRYKKEAVLWMLGQ